ncbi:hypothetical protein VM1G_08193 [Cytospora mali]|uniref:Uncharacterized protein n=1 Tax=Cytospora mali TaxID=578113 RepID=A0A194W9A0_CYTMA|nr:hypothetical protein VM1G_08193 [Valsa mali]
MSNCLSTIIACTWSVQHLNVPGSQRDGKLSRWLRSVKWMIITILFPELMIIHAVFELIMAVQALRMMEQSGKFVERPWWLQQFSLSSLPKQLSSLLKGLKHKEASDSESQTVDVPKWTLTHCYFANMGGFYYKYKGQRRFPLTALQLATISDFESPTISEEEIVDKSKRDWFAKTVAALGFLQLALSLIVRTSQGLAFSQLETITLGFAVCGAAIYLTYLYKPQKVETAIPLERSKSRAVPLQFKKTYDSFWHILMNDATAHRNTGKGMLSPGAPERIPNDSIPISESRIAHPGVFLLAFASGLFGAMHAIAWGFEFPSNAERMLWQAATTIAGVSPVIGLITIPIAQWTVSTGDPQLFARKCLKLMKEYSRCWYIHDKYPSTLAQKKLKNSFADPDIPQSYIDIFSMNEDGGQLVQDLLEFLNGTGKFNNQHKLGLRMDNDFKQHFQLLHRLLREEVPKNLLDAATTKAFPRKNLLPPGINLCIIYLTGPLYCLSRISLLAIGFSSLRQMSESVYVGTLWRYIPTLGSSG